jgi:phospholipase D1/2
VPGLALGCVNVHSELMFVDDDLLLVGSANLNNRSMVLDAECNGAIDARGDPRVRAALAKMRNTLLAEHLGCEVDDVAREIEARHGMNDAIAALQKDPAEHRTLQRLNPTVSDDIDRLVPPEALIDPETPVEPDQFVSQFVRVERPHRLVGRFAVLGVLALVIVGSTAAWHWTPFGDLLKLSVLTRTARHIDAPPLAPLWIMAGYVLAAVVSIPITLLIATTGLTFGAAWGSVYALAGTMVAAAVTYLMGQWLGRDVVRRLAGARVNKLSERVAKRGMVAIVVLRLLPVALFTTVNLVAGASHIGMRDFMLGTLFGMGPGIMLTVAFAHQLAAALRHPSALSFVVLVGIGAVLVAVSLVLQRFLGRADRVRQAADAPPPHERVVDVDVEQNVSP